MKPTIKPLTADALRDLSEQPNVTVMEHSYDVEFEPWSVVAVSRCVEAMVCITRGAATAEAARARALENDELESFSRHYRVMFEQLTQRAFVDDEHSMRNLRELLRIRLCVEEGSLDVNDANAQAAQALV